MKYENYALIQENWNKFTVEVTEDKMELDEGRAGKIAATALAGAVGLGVALDLAGVDFASMILTDDSAPYLIAYALFRLVQKVAKQTGKSPKEIIVNHLDAIDKNPRASAALRYLVRQASVIIDPKSDEELKPIFKDEKALEKALAPVVDKTKDAIQNDQSFKDIDPSADKSKASLVQPVPVKITE